MDEQIIYSNKCRTCFSQTKALQPLAKLAIEEIQRKISYAELLREVTNINVTDDKDSEMPQHICLCCSRRLKSSHAFIKQAQEINEKLWSLVNLSARHDRKLDCLEESEIDIQKCLEIKMETDQDDGDDTVKNDSIPITDTYESKPKAEFTDNIYTTGHVKIVNKGEETNNETIDTDYDKDLNVLQSPQEKIDSSESDLDDKNVSSIDLDIKINTNTNDELIENSEECKEEDQVRLPPKSVNRKRKHSQKESLVTDEDTDIAVPCLQCNKIFNNSKELSRHLRNTHVPEEQKCACPVCGAKFTRSCNMYKHMRTLHEPDSVKMLLPTKEKTHECEKCHRKYTKKKHLNYHIKVKHDKETENSEPLPPEADEGSKKKTEVRPLCFICGGSFSNKAHLIVHMRRHTGEKPFKCDLCERAFPRISDLTCHRRIHTGEKPYKCKICEKTFRVSTKLATHMRSHTDERPYKCSQCERSFKYSKDLNIHTRIHTGERPYCCTVCGSTFTQSNSLKAHRMKLGHMESCT